MTAIGRVTHMTVRTSTLGNLQDNLQRMSDLQAQMSSGKKINKPSDDPAGASDMLRLRGEQRMLEQYGRNADDGEAWLTTIGDSLTTSLTGLRRARVLALNGGDAALGTVSREALAQEIDGLRSDLMRQANTTYLGRSVFAGTSAGPAFVAAPATPPATGTTYGFTGVPSATVMRTVADGTSVRVDSPGDAVFGTGDDSVFAVLDSLSAALRKPETTGQTDELSALVDKLDVRMNAMLTEVASVGARQNQIDGAQSRIADQQLTAKTQLGKIEDIDLAQVILDLGTQEVAYKGALGAAAKVLQPTLLDFLR